MIRIWKGIEKEAVTEDGKVPTLFVCSDVAVRGDLIVTLLITTPDVQAIYFGAGRKEFIIPTNKEWDKIFLYCVNHNIKIIIEVSPIALSLFAKQFNHEIITLIVAYYNAPENLTNLYFKTDDYNVTKIFSVGKAVDITSLVENRYVDDALIYEE